MEKLPAHLEEKLDALCDAQSHAFHVWMSLDDDMAPVEEIQKAADAHTQATIALEAMESRLELQGYDV